MFCGKRGGDVRKVGILAYQYRPDIASGNVVAVLICYQNILFPD